MVSGLGEGLELDPVSTIEFAARSRITLESETRWIRCARAHLRGIFPTLPGQYAEAPVSEVLLAGCGLFTGLGVMEVIRV